MLTAKQIREQGIVTGPILDENIQQVGIDLNLVEIRKIEGNGYVPSNGKTQLAERGDLCIPIKGVDGKMAWHLDIGCYDIVFRQGCDIPSDNTLKIIQRSSILRNGAQIISSIFDPGFKTKNMGCVMTVNHPIIIGEGARVAQAYVHEHDEVMPEDLYDGQFQGDSQRKEEDSSAV